MPTTDPGKSPFAARIGQDLRIELYVRAGGNTSPRRPGRHACVCADLEFFIKSRQSYRINPDKILSKIKASSKSCLTLNCRFLLKELAHFLHRAELSRL